MFLRQFIFLLAAFLASISLSTAVHCYMPDGTIDDIGTVPCNKTTEFSACCDPKDSCSVSGLCLGASGWVYRSACTDPSWTAPECPAQCAIDPGTNARYSAFAAIVGCSSGTIPSDFCCGSYAPGFDCCNTSFALGLTGWAFKPGTDALVSQISALEALNSSFVSNSTTSNRSGSNTSCPNSSPQATSIAANATTTSRANLGAIVGLAVGIPLGILAVGIIGFLVWKERRSGAAGNTVMGKHRAWHGTAQGENMYFSQPTQMAQPVYAPGRPQRNVSGNGSGSDGGGDSFSAYQKDGISQVAFRHEMGD